VHNARNALAAWLSVIDELIAETAQALGEYTDRQAL
jgi:hypothetical protein